MIRESLRIVCPNQKVRFPISKVNPLKWIELIKENHMVFDVDGFIIDRFKKPSGNFSRFEIDSRDPHDLEKNDLIEVIINNFPNKIKGNIVFSKILNTDHWVIVTIKDFPKGYEQNCRGILSLNFQLIDNRIILKSKKFLTLNQMEQGIKKLRKMSFSKVKPLKSAPSHLSCYLNNQTLNPFPGDLDGIVIRDNIIRSLIEFKTHNIDSPIEDENIGKYGPQDWRRFNVLYSLQEEIYKVQNVKPKLFYIAWGTKDIPNHENIKIDLIGKNEVIKTKILKRPIFGEFSIELFNEIS